MSENERNGKLNLSEYTPEEIAKRMLETPPPPEKQVAKAAAKRKREEARIERTADSPG